MQVGGEESVASSMRSEFSEKLFVLATIEIAALGSSVATGNTPPSWVAFLSKSQMGKNHILYGTSQEGRRSTWAGRAATKIRAKGH